MKKLLVIAPFLLLIGRGLQAGSGIPQDPDSSTNVEWKDYKPLPDYQESNAASVAADSSGFVHFVQFVNNKIRYFNNRPWERTPSGYSTPLTLDETGLDPMSPGDEVKSPDICVDSQDSIHAVWTHVFYSPFSMQRLRYYRLDRDGTETSLWLTPYTVGHWYHDPQIAVSSTGQVHVVAYRVAGGGQPDRIAHIVKDRNSAVATVNFIADSEPSGPARFALKGNRICATWPQRINSAWNIVCSQGFIASGSTTWSSWQQISSDPDGVHDWPDVDLELSGTPHFTWTHRTDKNRIVHARLGGSATQVSVDGEDSGPFFNFEHGARVRIQGNQVHVFYGGFSHAVMSLQEGTWARTQALEAAGATNLSEPNEVAVDYLDRFILVNNGYYIRSKQSTVDGASWEPAFPGGMINLVPLNGSLRYRLDLFKASGVGPSTGLGLTYTSKERAATYLGPCWNMDHLPSITADDDDNVSLVLPTGLSIPFTADSAGYFTMSNPSFGFISQLRKTAEGWSLRMESGTNFKFTGFGRLSEVVDKAGNYLRVDYDPQGRPSQIVDQLGNGSSAGRSTVFEYGTGATAAFLTKVIDPAGRRYRLDYTDGRLSGVVFEDGPDQPTYRFTYNTAGLLSKVVPPRGNLVTPAYGYSIFYDPAGRAERVDDPAEIYVGEGQGGLPSLQTARLRVFYNLDSAIVGQNKFHTRVQDRRGFSTIHVFNPARSFAVSEVWDPAAIAGTPGILPIVRTHDQNGNVLTQTDRYGNTTTMQYYQLTTGDPGYWMTNLVKNIQKPLSGLLDEEFTYTVDEFRNVATHTTRATPTGGSGAVPRTTSYEYDQYGRPTVVTHPEVVLPDGTTQTAVSRNTYGGPRRQLTISENEEGRKTEFLAFHPVHGLPESTRRDGGTETDESRYDVMGNLVQTRRPLGGPGNQPTGFTTNVLDGLYRVERVIDPTNQATINTFDVESHLVAVQPPAGLPTTTEFDRRGLVKGGTTPDGSWTQVVDANGNVRSKTSLRGFATTTTYDALNRPIETTTPGASTLASGGGGGDPRVTTWIHDGFSNGAWFSSETRVDGAGGRTTTTFLDARRRPIRVVGPDGKTVTDTTYDERDQVTSVQLSFDNVFQTRTETFRDARDRAFLVRAKGSLPNQVSDTTTFFNRVGTPVKVMDPLGNVTQSVVDARQRVVSVIDAKGAEVLRNVWGDDDLLSEVWIPNPASKGNDFVVKERRTYTGRKELLTSVNGNGRGLTYAYNAIQGQVNTVTDFLGRMTRTIYDPNTQRVDEVIVADGTANARRTKSVWDKGLLVETRVYNPQSGVYDAVFRNFYDEADRLERFEAPLVAPERYFYSVFDQEAQQVAGTKTLTHVYNDLGQRTSTTWSGAYDQLETRTYNGFGKVESVSNGTHGKTLLYDSWLGTPSVESFQVGGATWKVQTHVYDVGKRYTGMLDPENGSHAWTYDENSRVTELRYGTQATGETVYTVGGLADRTLVKDAGGSTIAETVHLYDILGRKVRQRTLHGDTRQMLADFEWLYDELDQVTEIRLHHLGVKAVLGYNERRELTQEAWSGNDVGQSAPPYANLLADAGSGPESDPSAPASGVPQGTSAVAATTKLYGYDPGGNRTFMEVDGARTDYTYNAASQLVSESSAGGTVSHEYDEWGNEVLRVTHPLNGDPDIQEGYLYNYLNLLAEYTKSGGTHWQYAYWPTGERYSKQNQNSLTEAEYYIPRAGDVVTEYSNPTTHTNSYAQGTGIDQKSVRIARDGQRRHYLGDAVGTVSITLTDAAIVSESNLKDVWGNPLTQTVSSERYGFAQREHDKESGLVHMRARQYDPRTGRFTQRDPILGNRPNEHYAYGGNNPVSRVDPMGQDWTDMISNAVRSTVQQGRLAAWDLDQKQQIRAYTTWARNYPRDAALYEEEQVRARDQVANPDFWRFRKVSWDFAAKVTGTQQAAIGVAGGIVLAGAGGPVAAAAGTFIALDSASQGAGVLFGSEADVIGQGYRHYFGDEAAPWVRTGVNLGIGLAGGLPRGAGVPRRSGSGAWDAYVRQDQALPQDAPLYYSGAPELHRPDLRVGTKALIEAAGRTAGNGRWIDANTGKAFPGKPAYGHTYGNENWRILNYARDTGMTQEELNNLVNSHPEWFQLEKPANNFSHKFEMPPKDPR